MPWSRAKASARSGVREHTATTSASSVWCRPSTNAAAIPPVAAIPHRTFSGAVTDAVHLPHPVAHADIVTGRPEGAPPACRAGQTGGADDQASRPATTNSTAITIVARHSHMRIALGGTTGAPLRSPPRPDALRGAGFPSRLRQCRWERGRR